MTALIFVEPFVDGGRGPVLPAGAKAVDVEPEGLSSPPGVDTLAPELIPPPALRDLFRSRPDRFSEAEAAYRRVLEREWPHHQLDGLLSAAERGTVVLLYRGGDPLYNYAHVLAHFLLQMKALRAEKRVWRRRGIMCRRKLGSERRRRHSEAITRFVRELSVYRKARALATYLATDEEVDTWGLVRDALAAGKEVWAPKVEIEGRRLLWGRVTSEIDLVPGPLGGILEPRQAYPAGQVRPDVVFVPGTAFDGEGYRIGYGGGYYDRVLSEWSAVTVGLAFNCQRFPRLPREPHDRPVAMVVSETGVFATGGVDLWPASERSSPVDR